MEEKRICDHCGRILSENEGTLVGTDLLCDECVEDYCITCDHCGTIIWTEDSVTDGEINLCRECFNDHYRRCEECDHIIHDDDICWHNDLPYCCNCYDDICDDDEIEDYSYKPDPIFYGKGERYFGVELEVDCGGKDNENARTLKDLANCSDEHIYIKSDGSIDDGFEIVSHPTRMTTQGSEKHNCNNHPFESEKGFALAHNGVLYNDKELKEKYALPATEIETDSYVAVQLLEYFGGVNAENIKRMSELVEGSFVFTILGNDNTLFLVKGCNPLTLYHFPDLGLYVYASTKSILDTALKKSGLTCKKSEIRVTEGEILQLNPDGTISKSNFKIKENLHPFWNPYNYNSYEDEILLEYCKMFGVSEEDVELLLDYGYDADTIEEMLMNTTMLEEALAEIKIGGR